MSNKPSMFDAWLLGLFAWFLRGFGIIFAVTGVVLLFSQGSVGLLLILIAAAFFVLASYLKYQHTHAVKIHE